MIVMTDTQRDGDWLQARVGCATASRFRDVIATLKKGGYAACRQDYLVEIAVERLTGSAAGGFVSAAMNWGVEQEPAARLLYSQHFDVEVAEIGFCRPATLMAGASPDGLVDWDGLIEIKCPFNSAVHVLTWMEGMPAEHMAQVQGQLWITGRQWCDFVSFDPRMPEELQLYVQRVPRDEADISKLEHEIRIFLADVDAMVASLKAKAQQPTRAAREAA